VVKPVRRWTCEQAAVVPYRRRAGAVEIALITTGDRKRWILPKGWIDDGEDALDAALREAEEEAGLLGRVVGDVLHRYEYAKSEGRRAVAVFLMRVTEELDDWPEDHRRRRWVTLDEAHERVECSKLRAALVCARRRLRRA
jgi:8-oxo-dGTP pyrophosphatase MutT (NUDIX family)